MHNFKNDYLEGAHPAILKKLWETNLTEETGYGEDRYSSEAKHVLKNRLRNPDASIYFVSGGTQANLLVISSLLQPHEAVISADTGHIYTHETGAIEASGHRVITAATSDGKLTTGHIADVLTAYALRPHMVKPRLVYISNSTEVGSIYRKTELTELHAYCQAHGLLLYMDGARLGHALTAEDNDVALEDLTALTDVFYIGGTKNGALLGEAIVFNSDSLMPDFDYMMKQKGALMAKGRLLGIQFLTLFENDLYFNLARHANAMACKITDTFRNYGYPFLTPSTTNQVFPILPNEIMDTLRKKYLFYPWKDVDSRHTAIRLITSWATTEEKVASLIADVRTATRRTR